MKTWARRWRAAVGQWLTTAAGKVALVLGSFVSLAIFSTVVDKGGETMQLAVRTDALHVRSAGPLSLAPVFSRNVTLLSVRTVTVPGKAERALSADDSCFVEDGPPPLPRAAGAPPANPSPARLTFRFGAAQEIEFLREREAKEPSYYSVRADPTDPSAPPESRVTLTLQPGQQIRVNDEVIYLSVHGGQVDVLGGRGFQVAFSAIQPDTSRLVPTAIRGLGFLRKQSGPLGPSATPQSGLLGGELAFLTLPGEPVSLRQGANLILKGMDATLQSMSFAEDTLVANVSGEVDQASLQVGQTARVVQPTWFDYVLRSRMGRAAIGVIAALVGLLDNIAKFHGHTKKVTARGRKEDEPAGEKLDAEELT
jgi:hypothetical protein